MYAKSFVKVKGQSITPKASKDRLQVTVVLHTNDQMARFLFFCYFIVVVLFVCFFFSKIWLLKYNPRLKY